MKSPMIRPLMRAVSMIAIAVPGICNAQAAATNAVAAVGAGVGAGAAADPAAEILVTGTRIPRPEAALPSPVVAVTAEQLQQAGTINLTEHLKSVPALVGSSGSYENSGDRTGIGRSGLNLLNLRNLGPDRTLVLVDGRRHVSSVEGLQAVDLNSIPEGLIDRVEVSTGGASAIYGADAVSGVVNIILKHDMEGLTGRAQAGISSRGDAGQRLISLTAGHNFAGGRANLTFAWEHGEEDRLASSQRDYLSGTGAVGLFQNSSGTYVPLSNVRYYDSSRQGGIDVNGDGMPDFYGANGAVFDHGTYVPSVYQQGGSGTLLSDYGSDLLPRIRRDVFNAMATFRASEAFELHVDAKYARSHTISLSQPSFDYGTPIWADNPYIPASVQPYADANGYVTVNRDNFDFGPTGEDITRETVRTVVSGTGTLTPHLKYDLGYVFGRTNVTNRYIGNRYKDRFYDAIDVVDGPNGPTCRVNLAPYVSNLPATTFSAGSCQPINLFGEGQNSASAIAWLMAPTTDRSRIEQHVVTGTFSGDTGAFLTLPGGPARFAIGGEYRKEISQFTPDAEAAQGLTFANILPATHGSFDVKEAFGEVLLPLLADAPLAHRLSIGAALRLSDYSTVGSTTAWKIDGNWAPVPDLALRGTYSVAVRAPNISELYSSAGQTSASINDPCNYFNLSSGSQYRAANCQALLSRYGVTNSSSYLDYTAAAGITGTLTGNSSLTEERAKIWTAGVVLRPRAIPRLTITADWYDIRIRDAIQTASAVQVAQLCVDQASLSNAYCAMITRENGSGDIVNFALTPLNVASYRTAGLDVTLDLAMPTQSAGTFRLHVVGNYLHRLDFTALAGSDTIDRAGLGGANGTTPKYQATADLGWSKGRISANWRVSWFSKTDRFDHATTAANPTITSSEYLQYKARFVNDLYLSSDVTDQFQIYAGINNLFDQKPDIPTSGDTIQSPTYPVSAVGRYLYIGAKVKLADLFR